MSDAINSSNDPSETRMGEALKWAIEAANDPSMAAADWLTRDICAQYSDAFSLLVDPDVSIKHLRDAKTAFKTMRILGENVSDRQLAARLYAGAIAAALVRHGERISTQTDETVKRALVALQADADLPESLRSIAELAICVIHAKHNNGSDNSAR